MIRDALLTLPCLTVIAPPTPAKKDIKLPEVEDAKPAEGDAEVKPKAEDAADGETAAKKEEDDSAMQENGDEKPKVEASDEVKAEPAKDGADVVKEEEATPAPGVAGQDAEEQPTRKNDEDSILIPGSSTTLLIKTLPPDLSRADLEAVGARPLGCTV